jgi:hypothetical protein
MTSLAAALATAHDHHRAGRWAQAESAYRALFAVAPQDGAAIRPIVALAVLLDLATPTVYRSRQMILLALNYLRDGRPALAARVAAAVLARTPDHVDGAALRLLATG